MKRLCTYFGILGLIVGLGVEDSFALAFLAAASFLLPIALFADVLDMLDERHDAAADN